MGISILFVLHFFLDAHYFQEKITDSRVIQFLCTHVFKVGNVFIFPNAKREFGKYLMAVL